jgi:hypothetical protein
MRSGSRRVSERQFLLMILVPRPNSWKTQFAQVSRYLDRIGAPESSQKHGLLMVAFCRGLRRYAAKLNRLEFVGGAGELSSRTLDEGWVGQVNTRLELPRIVPKLRDQHGAVLMLRAAGYEWADVGQILGKSAAAVRISFWR